MIAELLSLVGILSNIKDAKDLLAQERLEAMNAFLAEFAGIQIITAIEELNTAPYSTRPEDEHSRAIGQLKVAVNALASSLTKRPVISRLLKLEDVRKMHVYLKMTGCNLIIASLYLGQQNMIPARYYADKASRAFKDFAALRIEGLVSQIAQNFVGVASNDQAVHYFIYESKKNELAMLKGQFGLNDNYHVFQRLAQEELNEIRSQLFGWLAQHGLG